MRTVVGLVSVMMTACAATPSRSMIVYERMTSQNAIKRADIANVAQQVIADGPGVYVTVHEPAAVISAPVFASSPSEQTYVRYVCRGVGNNYATVTDAISLMVEPVAFRDGVELLANEVPCAAVAQAHELALRIYDLAREGRYIQCDGVSPCAASWVSPDKFSMHDYWR